MPRCKFGYPSLWREQRQMLICDIVAAHPEAVSQFGISLLQAYNKPPSKWGRRILLPLYKSLLGAAPWPKGGEHPTRYTTKAVVAEMWDTETTLPARALVVRCIPCVTSTGLCWQLVVSFPPRRLYTVKTLPIMSAT